MPRLTSFAVCDDVRAEQGGKLSLIGFYARSVVVGAIPALMPKLCFFAQFDSLEGANVFSIRLVSPSGNLILEVPSLAVATPPPSVVPAEYRATQFAFQVAPMSLNEEGVYRVEYCFEAWAPCAAEFFVGVDPSLLGPTSPLVGV